ncbi:MAG TPA: hypothetical protein VGQ83_17055 [Polyangia bacterium]|jgi:hypothetical protein
MAKVQTRRSISVSGPTYEVIRSYCRRNNVSMSEFMEERVRDFFGGKERDTDRKAVEKAARIFTF